jgi:Ca2+-binding RTX toxin-like protein
MCMMCALSGRGASWSAYSHDIVGPGSEGSSDRGSPPSGFVQDSPDAGLEFLPPPASPSTAIYQLRTSWTGTGSFGDGTTRSWAGTGAIAYVIPDTPYASGSGEIPYQLDMTALMKDRARLAFELWDDLIARDLTETTTPAGNQIQFSYATRTYDGSGTLTTGGGTYARAFLTTSGTGPYGTTNSNINRQEIWLNSNWTTHDTDADMVFGSYGFITYLHEIGHTLGLSHPGTYNAGGGPITYGSNAEYLEDTRRYTVMSYFNAYEDGSGTDHSGSDFQFKFAATPMLHDVAAIQAMYGADTTTRTGNTTYGFNSNAGRVVFDFTQNTNPIVAIWDAAGTDTLDVSGFSQDQRIDLRAGTYSDVGAMTNNVAIAFNAIVENAVAGSGNDTITGNTAANFLIGGAGADRIFGDAGNDQIFGGAGDDEIDAGADNDFVDGGDGNDVVRTGTGNSSVAAGGGNDQVYGGDGLDQLYLGDGDDVAQAGAGADTVYGGNGHDSIATEGADDFAAGEGGNDSLFLGGGNDRAYGGADADSVFGEAGNDWISGDGGHDYLDGGAGDDQIDGGDGNDQIVDHQGGNDLAGGGPGDDSINLGPGSDVAYGNDGHDVIYLGADWDVAYGGTGDDLIDLGEGGYDVVFGEAGNDTIYGEGGQDDIYLGNGDDVADGGAGTDVIRGMEGHDNLGGGDGTDYLRGGDGLDLLTGGRDDDKFVFDGPNEGADTILDFDRAEGDQIWLSSFFFGIPNETRGNYFSTSGFATSGPSLFYDQAAGALSYDADGTSGAGAAVVIAQLNPNTALTASDLFMI